jgi:hypothetical protein
MLFLLFFVGLLRDDLAWEEKQVSRGSGPREEAWHHVNGKVRVGQSLYNERD